MTTVDYWYELLNQNGEVLGTLEGVARGSGRTLFDATRPVQSSMSLTMRNTAQIESWLNIRVQPWVSVDGDSWPLGVFIPDDVPDRALNNLGETTNISLLDKTSILSGDGYGQTYGATKNTTVTDMVADIIASTGEPAGTINESGAQLVTSIEWEPDATKLDIVNDLLEAASFMPLWVDGTGRFQVTPWQPPSNRPVVAEFVDGENDVTTVYAPDFTIASNLGRIPNVYIALSQGDGDDEALRAEAVNNNADDEFSLPNRGYRKLPDSGVERNVKTTSQEALQDHVERRLIELSEPQETVTIAHPPRRLRVDDVVSFTSRRHDIDGLFTIVSMDWAHVFNGLITTTLRRVVDLA